MNKKNDHIETLDIMLTKDECVTIKHSASKCPILNTTSIIPFADKFYGYCILKNGKNNKSALSKSYISSYCYNTKKGLAYKECIYWKESPEVLSES